MSFWCTISKNGHRKYYMKGKPVTEEVFKARYVDWDDEKCMTIKQRQGLCVKFREITANCDAHTCKTASTIIDEYLADSKTVDKICADKIAQSNADVERIFREQLDGLQDQIRIIKNTKDMEKEEIVARLNEELKLQQQEKRDILKTLQDLQDNFEKVKTESQQEGKRMKEKVDTLLNELQEKDKKLKQATEGEASLMTKFIDIKDKCKNIAEQSKVYQDTIKDLEEQKTLDKGELQKLSDIKKELETLQISLEKKAEKLERETMELNEKLNKAQEKLMEVGDRCLFSEESAQQCIKEIRNKYPNVAGILTDLEGQAKAFITEGKKVVPIAPPIPLPPSMTQGATPFVISTKKGAAQAPVVPVAPQMLPFAPQTPSKKPPTAPVLQIDGVSKPMAASTRSDLLSAIQAGKKLSKVEQDMCKEDEYYSDDGSCLKYENLRGFDEDECDEDEGEEFRWKTMSCAKNVDKKENSFYKLKYQKHTSKGKAPKEEDTRSATFKGISSLKELMEDCEKQGLKYSIKEKRCIGGSTLTTPVKSKQEAKSIVDLSPFQKAMIERRAAISGDEDEDEEWDE